MKLKFQYGTQEIEFTVIYRKRKSISIEIEPPTIITVIAPEGSNEDIILSTVKTKAKWITQKLYDIREMEYRKRTKQYVNGESFLYLGRNYSLQLEVGNINKVKLYHGKLIVTLKKKMTI